MKYLVVTIFMLCYGMNLSASVKVQTKNSIKIGANSTIVSSDDARTCMSCLIGYSLDFVTSSKFSVTVEIIFTQHNVKLKEVSVGDNEDAMNGYKYFYNMDISINSFLFPLYFKFHPLENSKLFLIAGLEYCWLVGDRSKSHALLHLREKYEGDSINDITYDYQRNIEPHSFASMSSGINVISGIGYIIKQFDVQLKYSYGLHDIKWVDFMYFNKSINNIQLHLGYRL